jgi:hypothetical protein
VIKPAAYVLTLRQAAASWFSKLETSFYHSLKAESTTNLQLKSAGFSY